LNPHQKNHHQKKNPCQFKDRFITLTIILFKIFYFYLYMYYINERNKKDLLVIR
jgi:hypothetical protein